MRAIGITDFLRKTFDTFDIEGDWLESFGHLEKNFKMSITGGSGGGKTELSVRFVKYLVSKFNVKADYFSYEQGISKSLQAAIERNLMEEVKGKVMFIEKATFEEVIERLKRKGSAKIVVIDSQDYCDLTTKQFKILVDTFPKKSFIVISWAKNDKPKNQASKDIEYMSCIKVLVKNGKAFPISRFGGNKPFVIFEKKEKQPLQGQLF